MASTPSYAPESAIVLKQYEQLGQYAEAFAGRRFDLLAVFNAAGLGKTQLFKSAMGYQEHLYVAGHESAFGLYRDLYESRNLSVILDDADSLFRSPSCAPLLKSLCDTVRLKVVRWNSRAAATEGLACQFTTTSRVAILGNCWSDRNPDMRAVADRGVFLFFAPDAEEVHRRVTALGFVKDDEIMKFMASRLSRIAQPSMRFYVKALQLKRAGITEWRDQLGEMLDRDGEGRAVALVQQLLQAPFPTEAARVAEFTAVTGKSPATFYRYRKQLDGRA